MTNFKEDKIILTDIDGVVLDFGSNFHSFLADVKNIKIPLDEWAAPDFWQTVEWSDEDKQVFITEFAHSDYFRDLPAKECALDIFARLRDEGWRFIAITACITDHASQCYDTTWKNRADNLTRHFGPLFEELHLASWSAGKRPFLQHYKPTWWVEDHVGHATEGHRIGHKSLIMNSIRYKPEQNTQKLPLVNSWHDIYDFIQKDVQR